MPTFITKFLAIAEGVAEQIIATKDTGLNAIVDYIIPREELRERIQNWFIDLPRPTFPRLSQQLDRGIKAGIINLPNSLSLSRALVGPMFLAFVASSLNLWYCLSLIVWAIVSDFFDGVLARKMKQETELGAALDAGCDKVFAICCAVSLWHNLWLWNALLFIGFDTALASLALVVLRAKRRGTYHGGAQVKANWLGKFKFCAQGLAGLCVLLGELAVGNWILLVANCFALGSLVRHLEPKHKTI